MKILISSAEVPGAAAFIRIAAPAPAEKQNVRRKAMENKKKTARNAASVAVTGAAVAAAAGFAALALNSRPIRSKRIIRQARDTMNGVSRMLSDIAKI